MKIRTTLAGAAFAVSVLGAPTPAAASAERMQLTCHDGTLAGHTLERTNGSSWWDVDDGTVYTTKSLLITEGDQVVYEKNYGHTASAEETCVGDHFEWTWNVTVVRAQAAL